MAHRSVDTFVALHNRFNTRPQGRIAVQLCCSRFSSRTTKEGVRYSCTTENALGEPFETVGVIQALALAYRATPMKGAPFLVFWRGAVVIVVSCVSTLVTARFPTARRPMVFP